MIRDADLSDDYLDDLAAQWWLDEMASLACATLEPALTDPPR